MAWKLECGAGAQEHSLSFPWDVKQGPVPAISQHCCSLVRSIGSAVLELGAGLSLLPEGLLAGRAARLEHRHLFLVRMLLNPGGTCTSRENSPSSWLWGSVSPGESWEHPRAWEQSIAQLPVLQGGKIVISFTLG